MLDIEFYGVNKSNIAVVLVPLEKPWLKDEYLLQIHKPLDQLEEILTEYEGDVIDIEVTKIPSKLDVLMKIFSSLVYLIYQQEKQRSYK